MLTRGMNIKNKFFYIYCHSATNLLLHQYLGKFEVTAEWLQISIFGKKDFQ